MRTPLGGVDPWLLPPRTPSSGVQSYVRDALLAAIVGGVCVGALVVWADSDVLWHPMAAVAGVVGALTVELAFVTGSPAARLWERPTIQVASVVVTISAGVLAALLVGAWILAAVCWGIATYFALLVLVLTGVWEG